MKDYSFIRYILLFSMILLVFSCEAKKRGNIEKEVKNRLVNHIKKVNLNNNGIEDPVYFYKDELTKNPGVEPLLYRGVSFNIDDKPLEYHKNLWTSTYDERDNLEINILTKMFGDWDGYCFVGDYNKNGKDEVTFYVIGGIAASIQTYEYYDNRIKKILSCPDVGRIEYKDIEGSDQKALIIVGTSEGVLNAPKPKVTLYTWNTSENKFNETDYTEEYWKDQGREKRD